MNNIGAVLREQGKYKEAIDQYNQIIPLLSRHDISHAKFYKELQGNINYSLGFCNMKLNKVNEALGFFEEAKTIYKEIDYESYYAYCELFSSKIKYDKTKNKDLIKDIEAINAIGVKYDDLDLQKHSKIILTDILFDSGRYKEAYEQNSIASTLKDSIADKELLVKLKTLQLQSDFQISQNKIEAEKKTALLNTELSYRKKINNQLLLFSSLLLLSILLLYRSFKATSNFKDQLIIKNKELRESEVTLSKINEDLQSNIELNI